MELVLVTGATSGIGRAIAIDLHRAGHKVIATGRQSAALDILAAEEPGIEPLALELTNADAVARMLSNRRIDILVNNAGISSAPIAFADSAMADIERLIAVNLLSVLHLTRLLVPQMRARQSGHILFIGSSAAHRPSAGMGTYSATKAAIAAFAGALRDELSPDGVRVTEIVPGRVVTGLYRNALNDAERSQMYGDGLSLQPKDVAAAVLCAINLPARATISRLDVMPTKPVPPIPAKQRN